MLQAPAGSASRSHRYDSSCVSTSLGGLAIVQSSSVARTTASIATRSLACWRRNHRKKRKARRRSGNRTAADTMTSRLTRAAVMAATALAAASAMSVLGRNASRDGGPMDERTASCPGKNRAISSGDIALPSMTERPGSLRAILRGARAKAVTVWPRARAMSTTCEPMCPVAPRTKSRRVMPARPRSGGKRDGIPLGFDASDEPHAANASAAPRRSPPIVLIEPAHARSPVRPAPP
jgi:hypothetical protein